MKRILSSSGTGLVSLHLIDASPVDVEPGAPLARHIAPPPATSTVATAAALSYRWPPRGRRVAAAGIVGALAPCA
jgi:hypothetical protein